jgi:hypothetical protein
MISLFEWPVSAATLAAVRSVKLAVKTDRRHKTDRSRSLRS